jgi:hypothetical protein
MRKIVCLVLWACLGQGCLKEVPLPLSEQRTAAVHEAAHIVAYFTLNPNFHLDEVWIATTQRRDQYQGETTYFRNNRPPTAVELRASVVAPFAGCAAEKTLLGLEPEGCGVDFDKSMSACIGTFDLDRPDIGQLVSDCLVEAQGQAIVLVQANADVINRLADLIMSQPPQSDKRTLSAPDIERLIRHEHLVVPKSD